MAFNKLSLYASLAIAAIVVAAVFLFLKACGNNTISLSAGNAKDAALTQVTGMREIGEWEFLSIEDEELVDTVRKGIFSDDYLVRVYYGTLRLGLDLREADDDWITIDNGTLTVVLPDIRLLDERFIDEARTKSFFESGSWSDQARADMYRRARDKMTSRCLTSENIKTAEENAIRQFRNIMTGLGFDDVSISFKTSLKE